MTLRGKLPLDEVAEFYLSYLGLKTELRGPIISELRRKGIRFLSLELFFELAYEAEGSQAPAVFIGERRREGYNMGKGYTPLMYKKNETTAITSHHAGARLTLQNLMDNQPAKENPISEARTDQLAFLRQRLC